MSIQKLHYENISGILVRREGLLSWRCPLCKAEGQSLEVMRTCPECGSKEAALPGAQPAPSVPEDVMRDAERYRYLRARDDGTAGVGCWIEADGRACDRGWLCGAQLDSAIDSFIEVLAAAPKPEGK